MLQQFQKIENVLNHCLDCKYYREQDCGAFFAPKYPEWNESDFLMASLEEREFHRITCLSSVCDDIDLTSLRINRNSVKLPDTDQEILRLLANCKNLISQMPRDILFMDRLGNNIETSIFNLIAELDYQSLERGKDILSYIQLAELDYKREEKLYPLYPKGMIDLYLDLAQHQHSTSTDTSNAPRLKTNDRLESIPRCGVKEIDALSDYYGDAKNLYTNYSMKIEDSFRMVCRNKSEDPSLSNEEKKIWARRIVNTIDSVYTLANKENNHDIIQAAISLFAILESEFMQMTEPICIKRLGFETDAISLIQDKFIEVIPNEEGDGFNCTGVVSLRRIKLFQELGKNASFYNKNLCDKCELDYCPYSYYNEIPIDESPEKDFIPAECDNAPEPKQFDDENCPQGIPQPLWTDESKPHWKWALENHFVTRDYTFRGTKREMTLFAACLSMVIFGRISWIEFQKWGNYKYYAKTYSEISSQSGKSYPERMMTIFKHFSK